MGDPSGIGPAITLKAMDELKGLADFIVIGDAWVLEKAAGYRLQGTGYRLVDLDNVRHGGFGFGKIRAEYGRAALEYLERALALIKRREIDCLVTCPVSKEAINLTGESFSGATEYLAGKTASRNFGMMLLNRRIKFFLLTRHLPLGRVPAAITPQCLEKNILLALGALKKLFRIKNPRIVVCGLNPHASDNGAIGREENEIIRPALERIKRKNKLRIDGPVSADVAVYRAYNREYDCVIACYHDQAMIPLKLISQSLSGVNLTLGLPFARTSPLHGTGFDIAGDFRLAHPGSLIEAIKLAIKCVSNLKRN